MNAKLPLLDYIIRSGCDWYFRKRTLEFVLIEGGVALLVASLAVGWAFSVRIPISNGTLDFTFDSAADTPAIIAYGCFALGFAMVVIGTVVWGVQQIAENRRLARKRVIVIEQRGLRDTTDTPLVAAVPATFVGHRDDLLVNLRQGNDGAIVNPQAALDRIIALPQELEFRRAGRDRVDVTVVYGGLVPVPFAFLTGLLIDDESLVTIFDWDRNKNQWRALDGEDDGIRFTVSGLSEVPDGAQEAILAVSVSYKVDIEAVRRTLGDLPLVQCVLPNGTVDCHWSEEKQQALARTFRDTASALSNAGLRKLHVFIAAQNSVTFRLGRSYDKRNLPPAVVYQYERSSAPPYPWGVLMPVHGIDKAQIVRPEYRNVAQRV